MSLTKTEPGKAAEINGIISSSLLQLNRYEKPNLNRSERDMIKKLRTKKDLVITKADKGNVVALLDKPHYVDKTLSLLNSATYMPIQSDPTLQTRTELRCLLQTMTSFFRENDGAPMGGPLPPVHAELFMQHLEETAFEGTDNPWVPHLLKRYVDDIFAIVKKGQEDALLEHLNSIFPGQIAFAIEKEVGKKLPFLGVLVHRRVKRGVVTGMVDHAVTICDPKFLNSELRHIATALQKNGYPQNFVTCTITRRLHAPRDRPNDEGNNYNVWDANMATPFTLSLPLA
ncbi:hypothetical protein M514_22784 [Trichuris suis]|uniref:Helix-turn-helix domain-containing protein n=1 Tax=Trichuris suis TaxID=68888 RepID=A0A085N6H1_9BILA|nr:hypothetical protein M514_22784 [Trichuris suis]